jgi:hypothetical protein
MSRLASYVRTRATRWHVVYTLLVSQAGRALGPILTKLKKRKSRSGEPSNRVSQSHAEILQRSLHVLRCTDAKKQNRCRELTPASALASPTEGAWEGALQTTEPAVSRSSAAAELEQLPAARETHPRSRGRQRGCAEQHSGRYWTSRE